MVFVIFAFISFWRSFIKPVLWIGNQQ